MGHVERTGKKNGFRVLTGKTEENRPLGRSRCRWEDTRMDLKRSRMAGCGLRSSGSEKTSAMDCREYVHEPSGSIKCEELLGRETVSFSRTTVSGSCSWLVGWWVSQNNQAQNTIKQRCGFHYSNTSTQLLSKPV
jgi:hypothetical protein